MWRLSPLRLLTRQDFNVSYSGSRQVASALSATASSLLSLSLVVLPLKVTLMVILLI